MLPLYKSHRHVEVKFSQKGGSECNGQLVGNPRRGQRKLALDCCVLAGEQIFKVAKNLRFLILCWNSKFSRTSHQGRVFLVSSSTLDFCFSITKTYGLFLQVYMG